MTYYVTVPADGNYTMTYRVASQSGSLPGLRLDVDGVWVDAAELPSTGGWQSWQTVTGRTVALVAGSRSISLEAKSGGFNLNWIGLTLTDAAADAAPVEPAPESAVTYTVTAAGATSVSMHSSAFSWNLANALAAVDNADGTWTATIDPGLSQGMEYKWIVDGTEEDFSAAYNAGDCATDNVVAYDNTWFNRTWASGAGNVTGDIAGTCSGTGTGDIGTGSDAVLNIDETISFNDQLVDYALVDSGNNTSQITADPQEAGNSVVSSSKVSDLNAGTTLASGTITYPLTDTLTRLSMRVYSPLVGVPVRIKLEESGDASNSVEAEMLTTVANQWEVIIFDFSNQVAGTAALDASYSYDSLSVYFDYGSAGNGETYYWDDVTFLDAQPIEPPATTGDNFVASGNLDDDSGWTVINHYEAENTNGDVNFANGIAMLVESDTAVAGAWKHIGIYTVVNLQPGTYQFEMSVGYANIGDAWGEVYIGASEPVAGSEYNGDQQVLKVFNAWECADKVTYSGPATALGCDASATPGQFEIATAGTYYLLFRAGGASYGAYGIVTDNYSIKAVE